MHAKAEFAPKESKIEYIHPPAEFAKKDAKEQHQEVKMHQNKDAK